MIFYNLRFSKIRIWSFHPFIPNILKEFIRTYCYKTFRTRSFCMLNIKLNKSLATFVSYTLHVISHHCKKFIETSIFWILLSIKKTTHDILLWIVVVKRLNPPFDNLLSSAPCCFLRALSHIAGRMETVFPFLWIHLFEQTRTPKHDFFKMLTLWLLVFRIAHPDVCFLASSELGEYT